jgi:hypothetical protein
VSAVTPGTDFGDKTLGAGGGTRTSDLRHRDSSAVPSNKSRDRRASMRESDEIIGWVEILVAAGGLEPPTYGL